MEFVNSLLNLRKSSSKSNMNDDLNPDNFNQIEDNKVVTRENLVVPVNSFQAEDPINPQDDDNHENILASPEEIKIAFGQFIQQRLSDMNGYVTDSTVPDTEPEKNQFDVDSDQESDQQNYSGHNNMKKSIDINGETFAVTFWDPTEEPVKTQQSGETFAVTYWDPTDGQNMNVEVIEEAREIMQEKQEKFNQYANLSDLDKIEMLKDIANLAQEVEYKLYLCRKNSTGIKRNSVHGKMIDDTQNIISVELNRVIKNILRQDSA